MLELLEVQSRINRLRVGERGTINGRNVTHIQQGVYLVDGGQRVSMLAASLMCWVHKT